MSKIDSENFASEVMQQQQQQSNNKENINHPQYVEVPNNNI